MTNSTIPQFHNSLWVFAAASVLSAGLFAGEPSERRFNPILPDWIADPSVCKFGDTFYLYGTTDIDKELSRAGVPVVWKSRDFVNWSFEGPAIEGVDWQKPIETGKDKEGRPKHGYWRYWAPGKVLEKDGKYMLYVTLVDPAGNPAPTTLLVADKPDGPFRFAETFASDAAANGPLNREQVKAAAVAPDIDGDPFVDDDGKAYIVWRRRKAAALDDSWRKTVGPHIEFKTSQGGYSEGPVLFKRNGIYYYFYTIGGCDGYSYAYMMSKDGPLSGYIPPKGDDFVIKSNPSGDVWGPGHGNVFEDGGNYYMTYLEYGEGGTTRQVFANTLAFADDGECIPIVPDRRGVGYLGPSQETRTNIAHLAKWTASSVRPPRKVMGRANKGKLIRTAEFSPSFVADDDNSTRWEAEVAPGARHQIECDFGRDVAIDEVKMFFTIPAFGHNWKLEACADSGDGDGEWFIVAEENTKPCRSPHTAKIPRPVRRLRLTILDGNPGLWEFKIYAPL